MTTTNTFIGMDGNTRLSSRVLKPPGGGSSISFDEVDDFHNRSSPAAPVRQKSEESPQKTPIASPEKTPQPEPKKEEKPAPAPAPETPVNGNTNSVSSFPTPGSPEKMTNGSTSPVPTTPKASPENPFPTPVATPATPVAPADPPTPVTPVAQEKVEVKAPEPVKESPKIPNIDMPAASPPPTTNGTSHSSPSSTTPSSPKDNAWPTPEGMPNKSPDTKSRLFGAPSSPPSTNGTPTRPVKDRMKSNIFSYEDEGFSSPRTNGSPVSAPEPKVSPSPVAASAPRQRVPPGGFSTKLW